MIAMRARADDVRGRREAILDTTTGDTVESEDTQQLETLVPEIDAKIREFPGPNREQGYDPYNKSHAVCGGRR